MAIDVSGFYPSNPTNVPPLFTKPPLRYRLRALLVAGSLLLFAIVYLLLIAAFAGIAVLATITVCNYEQFDGYSAGMATLMIGTTAFMGFSCAFLALFFVKGLFKFPKGDDHGGLEITEAEHPRLFAFIRQICADTGAPSPAKIILSHEVNASVFYTCSFWSLFLPIRKNLHIGLGLVNCLNLSEFKAVMAHEFGHFSQRSMRFGAFVYTANRVIGEVIYGRDWLDDALKTFDPVLNIIRAVLSRLFKVINFAHASLSRQMEFQADLVAVSVTGSDAIVHGLLRTDFAHDCLEHTFRDLTAASDHGLWSRDLFHHQSKAADYLRLARNNPTLGIPVTNVWTSSAAVGQDCNSGTVNVFEPNETTLPPMWASHPQHFERERNCKATYIDCAQDSRSAWALFENPEALRQKMTEHLYKKRSKDGASLPEMQPAEEVQKFIDADRAETIYAARYHGMYEEGLISPGQLDKLAKSTPSKWEQPAKLFAEHADIFSPQLKPWLEAHKARAKDRDRLWRFANRLEIPKGGVFDFRGAKHKTAEAEKLLETLDKEITADHDHLANLDRRIYLVYMGMAGQLDGKTSQDLEYRYHFQLTVQEMIISLTYWNQQVSGAFNSLGATREPNPEAVQIVIHCLREAQNAMGKHIQTASTLRLPAFKNMQAGQPLSFFLDAKPVIHDMFGTEQILNGAWLNEIGRRHGEVIDKLRRILFKSLGSFLAFQEKVGDDWKARHTNVQTPSNLRELSEGPSRGRRTVPAGV